MPNARTISAQVYAIHDGKRKRLQFSTPPMLTANADSRIRMSLNGNFEHDDEVDYINDMLEPVLIIDGQELALGKYMIGTLTRTYGKSSVEDTIEAYDQTLLLQQTRLEERLHFTTAMSYTTCIAKLLMQAGVRQAKITHVSSTINTDREDWEVGTDFLTIINELMDEINYDHIWFDFEGEAVIAPTPNINIDKPNIIYNADSNSVIMAGSTSIIDGYDAPNVFIARMINPDYEKPIIATAINDNPASALSTMNRGRRIVKVVQPDNCASRDELQKYVNEMRTRNIYAAERVTFATAINAEHQIHDVIEIHSEHINGVYLETGWSMELAAGGTMQHTAERMIYSL